MSATPSALTRYHRLVQDEMRAAFPDAELPIYDMARYAFGWLDDAGRPADASGKGARAALTMLGAEAISSDPEALRATGRRDVSQVDRRVRGGDVDDRRAVRFDGARQRIDGLAGVVSDVEDAALPLPDRERLVGGAPLQIVQADEPGVRPLFAVAGAAGRRLSNAERGDAGNAGDGGDAGRERDLPEAVHVHLLGCGA